MKLLFDQGTPAPLRERLPAHSADTLAEKGWSDKDNGELLDVAQREGYEVLVATDQSLPTSRIWRVGESALSFCFPQIGARFAFAQGKSARRSRPWVPER